ncbi:MAG TPA: hypothetical protein VF796_28000, partial [Humisphaera sp.]
AQRPPATPAAPAAAASFAVGAKVDIEWGNKWWPGVVKRVEPGGYFVGYDGWSESSDESVPAARVRARATP